MKNKKFIKVEKDSCLRAAWTKSTVGNKLGLFLAGSTFVLAHTSVWKVRSEATT